jgi:hypothetical protein
LSRWMRRSPLNESLVDANIFNPKNALAFFLLRSD